LWLRALTALRRVLTRRLIVAPEAQTRNGSNMRERSGGGRSLVEPMSALGHKRTFAVQNGMSALPPIADMKSASAPAPGLALPKKGVEKRLGWLAMTGKDN
jgi:hypothetical protein